MIGLKEYDHKAEVGKVGIRGNNPKQLKQVSLQHRPEHDAKRLISFLQGRVIWLCLFCLFLSVQENKAGGDIRANGYKRRHET